MLTLLLTRVTSAQPSPPTFDLQAPSAGCPNADPGYTCLPYAVVTNYSPSTCGSSCHLEYCFVPQQTCVQLNCTTWHNGIPDPISLGNNPSNGPITVCSEYRTVTGGVPSVASVPGIATINYIGTGPTLSVNSPVGILDTSGALLQSQLINSAVGQFVTYQAGTISGEDVTVNFQACPPCTSPVRLPPTQFFTLDYTLPFVWEWSSPGSGYNYIRLTAEDDAGNPAVSPPTAPSGTPFTLFDWTTTTKNIQCSPTACTDLANGTGENSDGGDIPGDPPSGANSAGQVYAGYADPTMRADALVTSSNPYGTNLWLGYSWPQMQQFLNGTPVGAVSIHLAQSNNGGASWSVWCSLGGSCPGPTPIYPSTSHPGTSSDPYYHISSHEVFNLWPHVIQPNSANTVGTQTWYGTHLMYFRYLADTLEYDIQNHGCLVVATTNISQNTQDSPGNLAWSTDPSHCLDTPPSGSVFLRWPTLNSIAGTGTSCASWGNPAIMVSPDGSTIYLAASCFDTSFVGQGYWIFTAPATGSSNFLTLSSWSLFNETFSYSSLPLGLKNYLSTFPVAFTYLTEFDWALRADGTIVAVVTPAGTGTPGQFGCVVLDFTLQSGLANPFGPNWATVTDTDTIDPNGWTETNGPNGCTYEPTSNTGVVIVRNLMNSSSPSIETYSIEKTGLMP